MDVEVVPIAILRPGLIAGAYGNEGSDLATPWHSHDMHQLLYAFEGSVEVEGRQGRYKVPRQFAAWIPAGAVHRTTVHKVASGSIFLAPDLISSEGEAPRVIVASPLLREMVMHAMRWPVGRQADPDSDIFYRCFASLCARWIRSAVPLALPSSSDRRIDAIMEHTRDNLAAITLGEICHRAGMSERTLRRRFREAAGISWEDYRQRLRLYDALGKLDETDLPIGIIDRLSGSGRLRPQLSSRGWHVASRVSATKLTCSIPELAIPRSSGSACRYSRPRKAA